MVKKVFVNIDMFSLQQGIFISENSEIKQIAYVPLDRVGETIYSLIRTGDGVDEVEIEGNQNFIQPIGYEIIEKINQNYSNKNVKVKLNGKIFN